MPRWLKRFMLWYAENDAAVHGRYREALYWAVRREEL